MEHVNLRGNNKNNNSRSVKSRARGRNGSSGDGAGKNKSGPDSKLIVLNHIKQSEQIVRRTFAYGATISSDASGQIGITSIGVTDAITSLSTEFTNFSQEYGEFRVKSLTRRFFPSTTSATSTTGPYQSVIMVAPWKQFRPANSASLYQSPSKDTFSTLYEQYIKVTSDNFLNGKLWTPVGTALGADRDFGISYVLVSAVAVTSRIFTVIDEIEVEFRLPM